MKVLKKVTSFVLTALMVSALVPNYIADVSATNMYANSDFIETEQPELSDETKKLISLYQKDPTEENYLNLRDIVIENYNAVLDKKEAKLTELKAETDGKPGGEEKVAEMEEIVQEMYITYWNRINSSMLRFTDTRLLKWKISNASQYDYIPVMGAGESIYVKRTPVTNAEYAEFINATDADVPYNWVNGTYPDGEDNYPVNYVSYIDAENYCEWLTEQDGVNTYRLPNESEWELAAGHMPKDADFNCGVNDGRTSVEQYDGITRGAHGAIDFWGNVWEWTSTVRDSSNILGVKGGSWKSGRTDCRTEYRDEGRDYSVGYDDVGFRVIQVLNGNEPQQKVELATLDSPTVSVTSTASDSITLSWQPVDKAVEYQIFEYFEETGLVQMLQTTKDTTVTIDGLNEGSTHRYIVQPISYVEIADNVSPENSVEATCSQGTEIKTDYSQSTTIKLQIDNPTMTVNGETKNIDDNGTAPIIVDGITLVPIRAIIENLGGTVEWNSNTRTAILTMNGIEIQLVTDSKTAYRNGEEKNLDIAPIILNDRTMFPIRFIAESFGLDVVWDEQSKNITIGYGIEQDDTSSPATLLYQGQGSIRIVTPEEKVIYIDPYAGKGYNLPADLILVTHNHSDHNAIDKITKRNDDCVIITQNEAIQDGQHQIFDFGYVNVEAVEAGYNNQHDVNECVGYVLTFSDGKKVYISGDTSTTQQMSQMAQMQIDYAFYCCDGVFNMGLEEAALCAQTVGAKHNIPYHMTGKTPKIYDRTIAEQFSAPNSLIVDAGEEIKIV